MELGEITRHNIKQLKRLNQVIFPVSYNDKFYKDVLEAGELAKLGLSVEFHFSTWNVDFEFFFMIISAYYNDIVVGAVCCRIDTTNGKRRLYIMTLGCLAPYRRLALGTVFIIVIRGRRISYFVVFFPLGTLMLEHVFHICELDGNIDSIFL